MATKWKILPVTVEDADDITVNNVSSFWQDQFWRLSLPVGETLENRIALTKRRQARNLVTGRPQKRFQKAVHPETGALVGYIRWEFPAEHTADANGNLLWPEALGPVATPEELEQYEALAKSVVWTSRKELDVVDNDVHEAKARLLPEKPYVKLDYLAVHPDYQHQGIAAILVSNGLKEVEKTGLPIFLYACTAGRNVYRRFGFRELYSSVRDMAEFGGDGQWGLYLMVRELEDAESFKAAHAVE